MNNYTICRGTGEWSALYGPDGALITYGDHYIVDDKIAELLGADTMYTNDFIVGTNEKRREIVAQTLAEVIGFQALKEERRDAIRRLRAEADRMEREL